MFSIKRATQPRPVEAIPEVKELKNTARPHGHGGIAGRFARTALITVMATAAISSRSTPVIAKSAQTSSYPVNVSVNALDDKDSPGGFTLSITTNGQNYNPHGAQYHDYILNFLEGKKITTVINIYGYSKDQVVKCSFNQSRLSAYSNDDHVIVVVTDENQTVGRGFAHIPPES